MHMTRTLRPLGGLVAAVIAAAAIGHSAIGTALAEDDPLPLGGQLAIDQSVDEALGVLAPLSPVGGLLSFKMLLQLPEDPFAFHGPQPYDLEPPASQSDFSDPTQAVNPRGFK